MDAKFRIGEKHIFKTFGISLRTRDSAQEGQGQRKTERAKVVLMKKKKEEEINKSLILK